MKDLFNIIYTIIMTPYLIRKMEEHDRDALMRPTGHIKIRNEKWRKTRR